jgi:hypothetical protein
LSLYTDRGSHYFYIAEVGGKVDRGQPTQVGRALAHLGVEHIAAYSPQARGRSERLFQTLQDRVPKELALAGIATMDQANAWLRDTYIPAHNARFAIKAEQEGSAFVAVPGLDLAEVLCVQEERVVGNDNCVSFLNRKLQIPESPLRPHFVRATVKVHQYPGGGLAIFHGRRCLGRYDGKGVTIDGPRVEGGHARKSAGPAVSLAPCSVLLIGLVPTIAESRVMIRQRDETDSHGDGHHPDGRGTAGARGVGWFQKERGTDVGPGADRAAGGIRPWLARGGARSGLHAGHGVEVAGPLCPWPNGGPE